MIAGGLVIAESKQSSPRRSATLDEELWIPDLDRHVRDVRIDGPRGFLINLADIHRGAVGHNEALLRRVVRAIKAVPPMRWTLGGDSVNLATLTSPSSPFEETEHGEDQIDKVAEILGPIVGQCVAGIEGNHPARTKKFANLSATKYLCRLLGVPYLESMAFVRFAVGHNTYVHVIHHSPFGTGGKRAGATVNRVEDLADNYDGADAVWGEHSHGRAYARKYRIGFRGTQKDPALVQQLLIASGSYQTWEGYARARPYRPGPTGSIIVEMTGSHHEKDMRVHERLRDFIATLGLNV